MSSLTNVNLDITRDLISAIASQNTVLIKEILSDSELEINSKDESGITPLYEAVWHGNAEIVELILNHPEIDINVTAFDTEIQSPLWAALYNGNKELAEFLISKGALLDITEMIPKMLKVFEYEQILQKLSKMNLSEDEYKATKLILDFERDLKELSSINAINDKAAPALDSLDILLQHTFAKSDVGSLTNFYNEIIDKSVLSQDIFKATVLNYAFNHNDIKLLILSDKAHIFLSHYGDEFLIAPSDLSKINKSIFIHELSHMFFDQLFHNDVNPFASNNIEMKEAYYRASKEILLKVAVDLLKMDLEAQDIDNLDYHQLCELMKDSFIDLFNIPFPIEYYKIPIANLINELEYQIDTAYNNHFDDLNQSDREYKVHQLINKYHEVVNEYHFTVDEMVLLARISDLIFRDEDEYDFEFIVRLPELQFYDLDEKTMSYFEPFEKYWKEYITPEVNKLVNEHFDVCNDVINHIQNNQLVCSNNYNSTITCVEDYLL